MPLLHILVLAVVQGVTEFLPVSSSGHLVLVPALTGWEDHGLTIDVAMHVGSLAAVVLYFRRDLAQVALGLARLAAGRRDAGGRLALHLAVATLPIIGPAIVVHQVVGPEALRQVTVIAWTTLGFGLLLLAADRFGMTLRRLEHMAVGHAFIIGLAQILALVPGTSRSGITITAARLLGYERWQAARFAMLLSVPTIIAAGTVAAYDLVQSSSVTLGIDALIAAGLAFIAALGAIAGMMHWIRRATFAAFVLYRCLLGGGLLAWIYLA
ncbi:MAG: undecaprenyl-diphosphate phosphatase [Kiloniellales bacterium]